MVRQAVTSKLRTLLTLEHARSNSAVIPAKAETQSNMRPKDTTFFLLRATHKVFALDSGLRRNDGEVSVSIDACGTGAEMFT